jgi:hypothetical protein
MGGGAAISGGVANQNLALQQSAPTGATQASGWHAQAEQLAGGGTTWSITAYAVCSP